MEIIVHRVNTVDALRQVDPRHGAEIDIRALGTRLILNHEPFEDGEDLDDFLNAYQHGTLILNIKEAGIEREVLRRVRAMARVPRHFLLDVEFPFIYAATRQGETAIAMRYSEDEGSDTPLRYAGKAEWLWIDTNTRLPLDEHSAETFAGFKTCLVCPERWGRPQDIPVYRARLREIGFALDAVMTNRMHVAEWEAPLGD